MPKKSDTRPIQAWEIARTRSATRSKSKKRRAKAYLRLGLMKFIGSA